MAAFYNFLEMVRLFIKVGYDKDKADDTGATPLYMAAQEGHFMVVQHLVEPPLYIQGAGMAALRSHTNYYYKAGADGRQGHTMPTPCCNWKRFQTYLPACRSPGLDVVKVDTG